MSNASQVEIVTAVELISLNAAIKNTELEEASFLEAAHAESLPIYVTASKWEAPSTRTMCLLAADRLLEVCGRGETTICGPELGYFPFTAQTRKITPQDLYVKRADLPRVKGKVLSAGRNGGRDEADAAIARASQRHRGKAQMFAQGIWSVAPTATIASIVESGEFKKVPCEGESYGTNTLRSWIKEFCPNRSAGRRTRKKD